MKELTYYGQLQERREALAEQLAGIDAEIAETAEIIKVTVRENGDVFSDDYHACFKPGRKSTDHESAATWANVPAAIIEKHTTTKTTVAWAKVTKDAKVNVEPFTNEAPPVFVIERI